MAFELCHTFSQFNNSAFLFVFDAPLSMFKVKPSSNPTWFSLRNSIRNLAVKKRIAPRPKKKTGEEIFQDNMDQMEGYDHAQEEDKDSDDDFDLDNDVMEKMREKRL